ncbi:hypothetical protein MCOR03_000417 [Pyricularia oryzae]|nr:hypothetical protein MCOR01_005266 [Pyricularia oryzae]KAI6252899.1 hypothetical protein MCOR19_010505 [Pyricularia oryzae]KAI6266787.1 hypothetical protein MCOR26_010002 [Pyricularia oryzae]KAI6337501.1 hypothetical protein MCOR28_008486 [Pyricularia oryzae]KAI6358629.1 hypothetical protein MCOR31_009789 [Pyricularia oryzae]
MQAKARKGVTVIHKQLLSFAALLLCNPLPGNFCIASPIRPITLLLPARPSVTTRHLSDSTQPTDPSRTRTLRTPATTPTPVPPCHNVIGEEQEQASFPTHTYTTT